MKRLTALILSVLILMIIPVTYADEASHPPRVVDEGDVLSDKEEKNLTKLLDEISREQTFDIVVVTTDSTGGKTPMQYADDYFDYGGYGFGENYDGVLLLVSMEYSDWWISTTGYGITAFTDAGIDFIGQKIVPYMSDGKFYKAFEKYAEYCDEFLTLAKEGRPFDYKDARKRSFNIGKNLLIALGIGFVLALIAVMMLRGQLKSVRFKMASGDYVVDGSMKITHSTDRFLTSHISRKAKPKQSSSGGSSTHSSSSGRSHGGGGGKF